MKNKTLKALIIVIVVQIVAFIGMAGYSIKAYDDVMNAIEYKMAIIPNMFYDNKIEFITKTNPNYRTVGVYGGYITINFEENGMAYFDEYVEDKPEGNFYVRANIKNNEKFREYEVDSEVEISSFSMREAEYEEAYIIFKANKGEAVVTGVYIDGIPFEEWVKNPVFKPMEETEDDLLFDDYLWS